MTSSVGSIDQQVVSPAEPTWADEMLSRYMNPLAFARKNQPAPTPELQEEKILTSSGGEAVNLEIHMLKERPFWSKVYLFWTFRLADVEGDDGQRIVVCLEFDTWTGAVQISENAVIKVDEIQKPIIGGSWTTKTDFGRLEIKIIPYWTGFQYELWFEGKEAYSFFA